uniref:Uncharacterized protein n=1 Tax=Angiostrongylus cantonensis TaxID=6313 RepID=A0A158P922_ANGCA
MRSPSEYNDGTPRTPLVEDDEENDDLARPDRAMDRRSRLFSMHQAVRPPCLPAPGLAPVPCPPPLPTYAGILPVTLPYGPYQAYSSSSFMGGPAGQFFDPTQLWPPSVIHPPFATIPNPWAPHVDRSGLNTSSTAQLSATTSTLAQNPPDRAGSTKFLGIPPLHKTPKKPGVLTPRRKRQS